MKGLRVCVDARLLEGHSGGVEQVVIGLALGLSRLKGPDRFLFLAYPGHDQWLKPLMKGPCSLLPCPASPRVPGLWSKALRAAGPARGLLFKKLGLPQGPYPFDGLLRGQGVDLVHFPHQQAFPTRLPNLYHPHDLQHRHLPAHFSLLNRLGRDALFQFYFDQATLIPIASSWGKRDLMAQYGVDEKKIPVVPLAPAVEAYPVPTAGDLRRAAKRFKLPGAFLFYPAQTWPHKNHLRLLSALHRLKEQGLEIPLVCSGTKNSFYVTIRAEAARLGLESQVSFLGYVSPLEIQCLYKLCRGVVIPTQFEATSIPLTEAFLNRVAAACSNVTALPDQARGGAALLFDPSDAGGIAAALRKLWTDPVLRRRLVERGRRNILPLTWDRAARHFLACYRLAAGRPLTAEDRGFLDGKPLL